MSRRPETFGRGAIEGVAAPESANNAAAQTSFIPLLTLGLPAHPVMALLVGAFIIQGITPGPNVIDDEPELFWGLIASMWVGNLLLVVLNLPLIGVWVRMLRVPYRVLFPAIVVFAGALKVCTALSPPVHGGSSCRRASSAPPAAPHVLVAADFGDTVGVKPAAGTGCPSGPAHS